MASEISRKYNLAHDNNQFIFNTAELDSRYPEVVFYNAPVTGRLSSEVTIGGVADIGISISVTQDSIHPEGLSDIIVIRPCFTGPFELPENYEPASPSYLIRHDMKDFQKDITIRMHHYASLQSEGDCEDMVFLTASSTPEYRESRPVYTFKEIQGAKGIFKPGDQVGEISHRHFCFLRAAKRKRCCTPESSSKRHKGLSFDVINRL